MPTPYNLASPQNIVVNEAGVGADGPYLFIGDQSVSPESVHVYQNNGSGLYTLLQTLISPSGNDFIVNQGCYDNTSGYLVLGCTNECYLYKVVAGLFVLQSTYNPGGGDRLINGAAVQISGTNVVLLGEDFATSQFVCKYLSVSTGAFVQLQSFNQAADPGRGTYLHGTASFSGTHLVIGNSTSFVLNCFELAAGAFSLVQTMGGPILFCNVLSLGYLFTVPTGPSPVVSVFTFAGTWTLSQTISFPPFPGLPSFPSAPYSFISSAFGVPILLLTASYTGADNSIQAASLVGTTWVVFQVGDILGPPGVVDPQGLVGAGNVLFLPNVDVGEVSIFLAGSSFTITLGLKGMKVYPQA